MNMSAMYKEVIKFIISSGKRISKKAGKEKDIGITKEYLTKEDLRIERELKTIIKKYDKSHELFAEEENDRFPDEENVWIADPISGTKTFIKGLPHYAIVVAYTINKVVQFSAIHDPATGELFTAYRGKGAFLNKKPIVVSKNKGKKKMEIIYNLSAGWKDQKLGREMYKQLTQFNVFRNTNSFAINYCHIACGRYDGILSLTKDAFTEIAASLVIKEAGGIFVNSNEEEHLQPGDRSFFGGSKYAYEVLRPVFKDVIQPD